ncbi:hypothetical protein [Thiohalomonas denitrificans]|uniref:Lipoprotein n=1 Tax=Thiohalomonas denitrificans TaxID=415747 RepID=A0A1G5Q6I6_9GAMM|nr:hypothetical protein [Thiohalomonas denitrificans]SCZ57474.1 hypothetical protein SAMN03097708_01435 [Thiohalomonas denitrificans]
MSKNVLVLIGFISILLAGCAAQPKNGDIIFAKVTHIFKEAEYRKAIEDKESFKGFFYERKLSMLESAINEGVTIEDVKNQRLVACECSCGAECYASYPLLLPDGVAITLYGLVELEAGAAKWQGDAQRYKYTLGKYLRNIDILFEDWARIEGNHNLLPVCDPMKWRK